jgi:hypothetical protein
MICCNGEPHTCDQEAIAVAEGKTDRVMRDNLRLRKLLGRACDELDVLGSKEAQRIRNEGGI